METLQCDPMEYWEDMEQLDSNTLEKVLRFVENFDYNFVTEAEVLHALGKDKLSIEDYGVLLSPAAGNYLEEMALRAQMDTKKHFGNAISMFTPLYISNYCENHCVYCGFHCHNKIKRGKLSIEEIEKELKKIAETGLREILLLTGESRNMSSVEYIGEAVKLASQYFSTVGLEIYPLNSDEYKFLQECGADFVSVYQETYDLEKYEKMHKSGHKRVFPYRFYSQERALKGGMRGVAFGSLLGLDDFRKDGFATGVHAFLTQQKYPHAEISFSCPRMRPYKNKEENSSEGVGERQLLQVMLAYRIFLPFAGITISTRESEKYRDNIIKICATKISAGVKVGVGGHEEEAKGDEQFQISDERSVIEIHEAIVNQGMQPVYSDYIRM